MEKTFKTVLIVIFLTTVFITTALRAKDSDIGLTVGIDYISNYIKRGQYHFLSSRNGDAFISPFAFFDAFNTGLTLGIKINQPEARIGSSWESGWEAYYLQQQRSVDLNADYEYNYKKNVSFNLGIWYYHYLIYDYYMDPSYFDFYLSIAAEKLLFTPTLTVTYSYYKDKELIRGIKPDYFDNVNNYWEYKTGDGKNIDFYAQLAFSHNFAIEETTSLDLGIAVGFFYKKTIQPKALDISEIDLSAGTSTKISVVTITTSLHYILIPGTQFKYSYQDPTGTSSRVKDMHKTYAKLGVSCSI